MEQPCSTWIAPRFWSVGEGQGTQAEIFEDIGTPMVSLLDGALVLIVIPVERSEAS